MKVSVLEALFPSKRMVFPFPAPVHWRNYERMFNCPIDFDADCIEWQFDATVLDLPCPNANPITAKICQQVCEAVLTERPDDSDLVRKIRTACLNSPNRFPVAEDIAPKLGLSLRTVIAGSPTKNRLINPSSTACAGHLRPSCSRISARSSMTSCCLWFR